MMTRSILLVGLLASTAAFSETVTIGFQGTIYPDQNYPGTGIYQVNSYSTPTPFSGSIKINTDDFAPDPAFLQQDDSVSSIGGSNSTVITLSDATGTKTFASSFSRIDVCSDCTIQWMLTDDVSYSSTVYFYLYSRNISVNPKGSVLFSPLVYSPGQDRYVDWFQGDIEDNQQYLSYSWAPISANDVPEPKSLFLITVGLLIYAFVVRSRSRHRSA